MRDVDLFGRVAVDETGDTIVWPNGADLDPDVIYGSGPPGWEPAIRITSPQPA